MAQKRVPRDLPTGGEFRGNVHDEAESPLDRRIGIGKASEMVGVSPQYLRFLTNTGVLSAMTTLGGHRRYDPDLLLEEWERFRGGKDDSVMLSYEREGLDEAKVWEEVRNHLPDLSSGARGILSYAVTEVVNNAIDHSHGTRVDVTIQSSDDTVTIEVKDDGIGAFESMSRGLGLGGSEYAPHEITKGKRTTAPDKHAGEGLFFSSRMVDRFLLSSNGVALVSNRHEGFGVGDGDDSGTTVTFSLDPRTKRSSSEVFDEFAPIGDDDDVGMTHTSPSVSTIPLRGDMVSRSEAKRLAVGLEKFSTVELDLRGVDFVGQGFADELLRVWRNQNPGTTFTIKGGGRSVRAMMLRHLGSE